MELALEHFQLFQMLFEIVNNLLDVDLIEQNVVNEIFLQQLLLYHQEHLIFQENQQHKDDNQLITKNKKIFVRRKKQRKNCN